MTVALSNALKEKLSAIPSLQLACEFVPTQDCRFSNRLQTLHVAMTEILDDLNTVWKG